MKRDEEASGQGNLSQRASERIDAVLGRVRDQEEMRVRSPGNLVLGAACGGGVRIGGGDPPEMAEPPEIPDYVDALDEERCDRPAAPDYVIGQPLPGTAPRDETDRMMRVWRERAQTAMRQRDELGAANAEAARTIEDQARDLYLERLKSTKLEAMVETHDRASVEMAEALGKVIRELREELGWRRRRGPMDITAARIAVLGQMLPQMGAWPFDKFMLRCEALARWAVEGPGEDESQKPDV
jgi:hypothetical protein